MRYAAIALLLVAWLPAVAEAKWTRVRSANFVFVGDASEGQIRRVAQKLEQFREVMLRALPGFSAMSPVPTVVMVFATDRSFDPAKPLFRGKPIELAGLFQPGEDINYVALSAEVIDLALMTIFHEYLHFLTGNSTADLPVWVSEGLAEVYEMLQERDGGRSAVFGLAPAHHVELLKRSTLMPIRELAAIDHQSPVYNEDSRRGVFYAESWALVHYLTLGNAQRGQQFRQYLSSMASGAAPAAAPAAAFEGAFGADASLLDRELFEYVRQVSFTAVQVDFGERVLADGVQRGETLDDTDADIYLADLQSRVGRHDEARTRLEAVLKKKPTAARATMTLGLQELRAGAIDAALRLLEQAATQDPNDGGAQSALGRALVARLSDEQSAGTAAKSATLERARQTLSRAVELDAGSAFATGMLGYVELVSGTDLPRAGALFERAIELAPSREQYRLYLAQTLLAQGEFTRATSYLGPLVARGRTADVRNRARELLGRVGELRRLSQVASTNATRTDPGSVPTPEAGIPGSTTATRPSAAERGPSVPLDLRPVGPGETRVRGVFKAIECVPDGLVLIVESEAGVHRLGAKQFTDVNFISYRSDTPRSIRCGAMPTPQQVLATYRAARTGTGSASTDGDAVAVELLPDGFQP